MRKFILFIVIIIFACSSTRAQDSKLSWGVKGGLNLANAYLTDDFNTKMKPSFNVGVFAEYRPLSYLGIRPELSYSRQGFFTKEKWDGETSKEWDRFNYFNVPIAVRFYPIERLSVEVGPQFGFLLNGKNKYSSSIYGTEEISITQFLNKFDFGLLIGASYRITQRLEVNFRYIHGLSNVSNGKEINEDGTCIVYGYYDGEIKNRVVQIGASFYF